MKALFELFRRFDARRIFGFIRRLLGMSRPKVKCYDLLSNHALRVEGDLGCRPVTKEGNYFYPRPPGGGRPLTYLGMYQARSLNFYPRPPGGGRHYAYNPKILEAFEISIHALRVEGDSNAVDRDAQVVLYISIHALRVEGDVNLHYSFSSSYPFHFYPRPPGGGRPPSYVHHCLHVILFLSTPSGWRATTRTASNDLALIYISIHALRVEGDEFVSVS